MRFKDKVAVVTGAGQGIGEDYAKTLAREGAAVVVAEINAENGERVAAEIVAAGGQARFVRTDVASEESARDMAAAAVQAFGGVDLLVNNAAIYAGMRREPLLKIDLDYYRRFMEVNMNGALIVTRAVYELMAARGGGAIVNQSSTGAYQAGNYYGFAKHCVNGLTNSLAKELGPLGIRINAIAPGPIDTMATRTSVPQERIDGIVSQLPLRRMGETRDVVNVCLFLLSEEASWVTGQVWCVDGGMILKA